MFSNPTDGRISQIRNRLPSNSFDGVHQPSMYAYYQFLNILRSFQCLPSFESLHGDNLIESQLNTDLPRLTINQSAVETVELLDCTTDHGFREMEDLTTTCRKLNSFSFRAFQGEIDRQMPLYICMRKCLLDFHRKTLELISLSEFNGTSRAPLQGEPVGFSQFEVLKELAIP